MSKGKYILTLSGVLFMVMLLVSGGTFAYWRWASASSAKTNISYTIPGEGDNDGIVMTITPSAASANNLRPTSSCANGYAVKGSATVTIVNGTDITAHPTFKLKAKSKKAIPVATWQKIKYAIVKKDSPCTSALATGTFSTGSFSSTLGADTFGHTADITGATGETGVLFNDADSDGTIEVLYNNDGTLMATSEGARPNATTTAQYDVWFWLDSSYVAVNTGTTVSDVMQNNTITVTWSENSYVTQISS